MSSKAAANIIVLIVCWIGSWVASSHAASDPQPPATNGWSGVVKTGPTNAVGDEWFGNSLSLSGELLAVGASGTADGAGAAYVFSRFGGGAGGWRQIGKVTAFDADPGDRFARSLAISGDTLMVGAPFEGDSSVGSVYVFRRHASGANAWGVIAKRRASDPGAFDNFGFAVAINGDRAVVGAPFDDHVASNAGSVYVLERNVGGQDFWGVVKKLTASDARGGETFGKSVAIWGDTIVVGAGPATGAGSAYVFERHAGGLSNWGEWTKLTSPNGATGDGFGDALSLDTDTIVVGARDDDETGTNSGAAYVFGRHTGGIQNWGQVAKLTASDGAGGERFGVSASVAADTIVVGAYLDDDLGASSGSAYVFERHVGGFDNWGEGANKLTSADGEEGDRFGGSVTAGPDVVVAGIAHDDDAGLESGAAYVFERSCGDGITQPWEECDQGSANSNSIPDACRTDCRLPACGDFIVDTGEACDDGQASASCDEDCTAVVCGDGLYNQAGEGCDDGNLVPGDGCSPSCNRENFHANQIQNGGFESGSLSPWGWFTDAVGTAEVVDGAACIETTTLGTNVQLFQRDLEIHGGSTYRLIFDADCHNGGQDCAAPEGMDLRVILHSDSGPPANYGLNQNFTLTRRPHTYAIDFAAPEEIGVVINGRLRFWFVDGQAEGNRYTIDNVYLAEAPPCGNGQADPGEECDDGNIIPDDGCEPDCLFSCQDTDADGYGSPGSPWCATGNAQDCDDTEASVYPGAANLCDGLNNDCSSPVWPEVPVDEADTDGDGYRVCDGDCADEDPAANPAALEVCNGIDDDCNALIDDDASGSDNDADGVANTCDNCPGIRNPSQSDIDSDSEGDRCDPDDALIYLAFDVPDTVDWQPENGFMLWNLYRGDLFVLRNTGAYSQLEGSNPTAEQHCGENGSQVNETWAPEPGGIAFYLVTGVSGGTESDLGEDSDGGIRPHAAPCL